LAGPTRRQKDAVLEKCQARVGPRGGLASPLSAASLARILGIDRGDIDNRLDLLHSVLCVPSSSDSPIRLLHPSFRDFLPDSDKRGSNPFWVNEKQTHENMTANCIRIMEKHLHKD